MLAHTLRPEIAAAARIRELAGAVVAPAATGVVAALLLRLAFDDGGYFPTSIAGGAGLACAALALALAVPQARRRLPPLGAVAVVSLVALALWTGLSSRWTPATDSALTDLRRDVLYAALFGLALVAAGGARAARRLVRVVLGVIVVIVGAGVLSRLQPDLLGMTRGASIVFSERLSYPLGYWNAYGALAAVGAVLACGLAADVRARTHLRVAAAAAAPLLVVAVHLSLSRGAWLALGAGVVTLLALAPRPLAAALSALVVGAVSALAIARLQATPQVLDGTLPAGPGADGLTVSLGLALVASGCAQALLARAAPRRRGSRRAAAAGLTIAAAVAGGALLQFGAIGWVSERYDEFRAPAPTQVEPGPARLLSSGGLRHDAYVAALAGFRAEPLRGEGAGSFELRWRRAQPAQPPLRDAHSLVLGTMSELGAVGLLLLLAVLGCVAAAAVRARRGGGALRRSHAAAVVAAVVTWLVHACIDWDWEMPALTGCALVLCATLFARAADPLQIRRAGAARASDA